MSRRGGLGVRKSMSEKIAAARTYRLTGVAPGSRVAETDKYRRWHLGYRLGYIMRNSTTSVTVQWDGESEFTHYSAMDARYHVDTNRWRIVPPTSQSPLDALTSGSGDASIMLSPHRGAIPDEENAMAAEAPLTDEGIDAMTLPQLRTTAKKYFEASELKGLKKAQLQELLKTHVEAALAEDIEVDDEDELDDDEVDDTADMEETPTSEELTDEAELDDELDDDEVTLEQVAQAVEKAQGKAKPSTPAEPSGETYTAKQVATRIGTDSKTLRKFFRSPSSTVEPVGQGGRYEFDKADLPKIKEEFDKWNSGKTVRTPGAKSTGTASPRKKASRMDTPVEVTDEDEELDLDDELEDQEPSDAEVLDIEDDELDDDEELDD